MSDVSPFEYRIQVTGGSIESFWDAVASADRARPDAFTSSVVAHDMSGTVDGFVSLNCVAHTASTAVDSFYTAVRVARTAVPLVSTRHKSDWFQCFGGRIGADLSYPGAAAIARIVGSVSKVDVLRLEITRTKSTLSFFGVETDVTDAVADIVSLSSPAGKFYLGSTDIYVVARRTARAVMGTRAEFELKVLAVMNVLKYTLCTTTQLLNVKDMYYTEFFCRMDPAASTSVMISPASGSYAVTDHVMVSVTPVSRTSTVHYTLDGTPPTAASPVYTAQIDVTAYSRSAGESSVSLQVIEVMDNVVIGSKSADYTIVYPSPVVSGRIYFNKIDKTYVWG